MKYFFVYIKGLLMGSADIIPGVSGGTIAFLTGIYDELLNSINSIKPSLISDLLKNGPAFVWKKINGNFLLSLVLGIVTAILSLAKLVGYLMHQHPVLLWSFFFGLILASSIYIAKEIKIWNFTNIFALILGVAFMIFISVVPPLSPNKSLIFLFFSGALAVCAMILPGISGSFILLILGAYSTVLGMLTSIVDSLPKIPLAIVLPLLVFVSGIVLGLLSFSRLLKYLLDNKRNLVISFLTGLMFGSLWKLWPWKTTPWVYHKTNGKMQMSAIDENISSLSVFLKNSNEETIKVLSPYIENNVLPSVYSQLNNQENAFLWQAILLMVVGFVLLFVLEKLANNKS